MNNLAIDNNSVASGLKFNQFWINVASLYSTFLLIFPLPLLAPRASGFWRVLLNRVGMGSGFAFESCWHLSCQVKNGSFYFWCFYCWDSILRFMVQIHMYHVFSDSSLMSLWITSVSQPVHNSADISKFSAYLPNITLAWTWHSEAIFRPYLGTFLRQWFFKT